MFKFRSGLQWFWWSQTQPTKKEKNSKLRFGSFCYSEYTVSSVVFELWSVVHSHFCVTRSAWSLWMVLVSFICAPYVFSTRGKYLWRQGLCAPFSWCWAWASVIAILPGMPFNLVTAWVNTCHSPWSSYWFKASILANWFVSCLLPHGSCEVGQELCPNLVGLNLALLCSSGLRPRVCYSQQRLWLSCKWAPE